MLANSLFEDTEFVVTCSPHCACSPGDGEFSIEQDRHVVGTVMRNLIETQMRSSLILGDLASYRFSVTFSQSNPGVVLRVKLDLFEL